jgi:tRNA threonylcarbamoyl adenosine modification protein (Sua5/YciO/YrdC/YwlC family)
MIIKLYEKDTNLKQVEQVTDILKNGGVIIYPTDTVYAIGCDLYQPKAVERVARMKGLNPEKTDFSFIFHNLSQISEFTRPISSQVFKLLKHNLPGPFTFILEANNQIPKLFRKSKKTIGVRIPKNNIILTIVEQLGNPVLTTSVHDDDEVIEYTTDPELIYEKYEQKVDLVIDGGYGNNVPSTVIDCTEEEPVIIREGIAEPRP